MKQKIATIIDADVLRIAKRQAVDEGRPLSDLIHDALDLYLTAKLPRADRREAAYRLFCEEPMEVSFEDFQEILQADV